jgi:hypothetical protein
MLYIEPPSVPQVEIIFPALGKNQGASRYKYFPVYSNTKPLARLDDQRSDNLFLDSKDQQEASPISMIEVFEALDSTNRKILSFYVYISI